ncbi:hypothetical protein NEMBOFW57_002036 [Staphylotrichum longicolle]|uniref:Amidase domain-containing protein n=1 Tax=Staphylotrichum longicolle TaxID=669026 RepID=A0AAD4I375_9PEZI|nr:hypothetical protein NEMBOFW57_002036 [Staphylotrichum longicolle]
MNTKPWVAEKLAETLEIIKSLGATDVEDVTFLEWTLNFHKEHKDELKFAFHVALRHTHTNCTPLKDVIQFIGETPDEELQKWERNTKVAAEAGDAADRDASHFTASQELRLHIGMDIARLLDKYECDILAVPMWTETISSIGGNPQIARKESIVSCL